LRELIACADITVAPSVFPEAFGMVAIEALASGVIPLQTNHSGFSEVITKYSTALRPLFKDKGLPPLVLDERLVVTLAGNISKLLNFYSHPDPVLRYEIRQRAREIAVDYSWSNMARQYLQLYKEIVPG
jgi:glycosyltransferase involved in cell wall biosynthesis